MRKLAEKYFKNVRLQYHYACRRIGIKKHEIHRLYLPKQELIYIPIPKNACTSIKHALYEIEHRQSFDYPKHKILGYRDIHDYYHKQAFSFAAVSDLLNDTSFTKFAVIRDPVKRLISCYRNRVVDLKDLESGKLGGLTGNPDINFFILNLKKYQKENKIIEHHSRPQHNFLGNTLKYLNHIFPIEHIKSLKNLLKSYQPGFVLPKSKFKGTTYQLNDLSPEALDNAIFYYKKDYDLLKNYYSPEKIWGEYNQY